jgi:hypothetical protein
MAAPVPPLDVAGGAAATSAWANSVADALQQLIADLYSAGAIAVTWAHVTGKPATFAPSAHSHHDAGTGGTVAYGDLTGKPATFAPSAHAASHGAGADKVTPAAIGAWAIASAGGGAAGAKVWVGTSPPGSPVEGDVWIKG